MAKKRTITFIPRVLSPRPLSFEASTVIIGSRPDADLVLDDSAEPVHALVRMRKDTIELAAFGPLELNGALVERAVLQEGDHIRIGRLSFVFVTNEIEDTPVVETAPVELPNLDGALTGVDRDPAGIPSAVLAPEVIDAGRGELRTEVALFWGNELLQVAHYGPGATVRVGEGAGNDFVLAAREIKEKSFVLVEPSAEGPRVNVPVLAPVELDAPIAGKPNRSARGSLVEQGRLVEDSLRIRENEKLAIALGALTMVIKRVPGTTTVTRPLGERIDQAFVSALTFTGIAAAFLFGLALSAPKQDATVDDVFGMHKRSTPTVTLDLPRQKTEGAAAQGQPGKIGVKQAKREKTSSKPKTAKEVGLLAVLEGMKGKTAARVLGPGTLGLDNFLGSMRGSTAGDERGDGGLSTRGSGPGGGGDSKDIGAFGKRGHGLDDADLSGAPRGERDVTVEHTEKGDPLAREAILRVLSRAQSQMRNCYERELGKEPDLHGKVVLVFTVGKGGDVSAASAREGTLQHAGVENCLERVVSRLRFPEPKGGASVTVKYPLVFTTTGR